MLTTDARHPIGSSAFGYGNELGHLSLQRIIGGAGDLFMDSALQPATLGEILYDQRSTGAVAAGHVLLMDAVAMLEATDSLKKNSMAILAMTNRTESIIGAWTFTPPGAVPPFAVGGSNTVKVTNLNADRTDDLHVHTTPYYPPPTASCIAAYQSNGCLAVQDPIQDYDAVNKRTLQASATGLTPHAPCAVATVASLPVGSSWAANVWTLPSASGVLVVDGMTAGVDFNVPAALDNKKNKRVLVKDETTTNRKYNGIYDVTNNGAVGVSAVLTRSPEEDTSTELTYGSSTVIEQGLQNKGGVFVLGRDTDTIGDLTMDMNTDPQKWTLFSTATNYTAGRGIVLNGLEINFAKGTDYGWLDGASTKWGQLAYTSGGKTMAFLDGPQGGFKKFVYWTGFIPAWGDVNWADIPDKPVLPTFPIGTAMRHLRWGNPGTSVEPALLIDSVTGLSEVLPINSSVYLGNATFYFQQTWARTTNTRALNPSAPPLRLSGFILDPTGGTPKEMLSFDKFQVKEFLAIVYSDINGGISLDQLTDVTISGAANRHALVYNSSSSLWENSFYNWSWLALRPTGTHNRMVKFNSPVDAESYGDSSVFEDGFAMSPMSAIELGTSVKYWGGFHSIFPGKEAPNPVSFLLGKTTGSTVTVKQFTAADVRTFLAISASDVALETNAVGYGVAGKLFGDATKLYYDYTPGKTAASFRILNTATIPTLWTSGSVYINSTMPVVPDDHRAIGGLQVNATDTSAIDGDWTNREFRGQQTTVSKTGAANTSDPGYAAVYGNETIVSIARGNIDDVVSHRSIVRIGGAGVNASVASAYNFVAYCSPGDGSTGSISSRFGYYFSDASTVGNVPIAFQYGMYMSNMVAGTSINRAIYLDVARAGAGTRHNLYCGGDADNYMAGRLGIGVATPTARLDFAAGTTTLAPIRFNSSANALLTTGIAGAFETDLSTAIPLARLYFTDGRPVRRPLAYLDDVSFTNDPASEDLGGVSFGDGVHSAFCTMNAADTVEPLTMFVRFSESRAADGTYYPALLSRSSGSVNYFVAAMLATGNLSLQYYGAAGTYVGEMVITGFRSAYLSGGRVVDLAIVRSETQWLIYANGALIGSMSPAWARDPIAMYRFGVCYSLIPTAFHGRCYGAMLFNRALSAADVLNLSRYGVDQFDQWGSLTPLYQSNFSAGASPNQATGLDGWDSLSGTGQADAPTHGNVDVEAGGPPTNDWLRSARIGATTGNIGFFRSNSFSDFPASNWKKYRVRATFFAPTGSTYTHIDFSQYTGSPPGTTFNTPQTIVLGSEVVKNFEVQNTSINIQSPLVRVGNASGQQVQAPGQKLYMKDYRFLRVGCLIDLDFGVGCGTVLPDRSTNGYHGVLSGSYTHIIAKCPTTGVPVDPSQSNPDDLITGSGRWYRYLRKLVVLRTMTDNQSVIITHGLGVGTSMAVETWDVTTNPNIRLALGVSFDTENSISVASGKIGGSKTIKIVIFA